MRNFLLRCALPFLLATAFGRASAAEYEWAGQSLGNDRVADFRLWVPDEVDVLRAVIVLVPGLNSDGRPLAGDADWQRLAREQGAALLGCSMRGQQGGAYWEAERWSGAVLLRALDELGGRAGHRELATAPLAMWGHSGGGQFNFNFACWKPARVLAFVVNKGAYYTGQPGEAVRALPALWIVGQNDTDQRAANITGLFVENRRLDAHWGLALEPNASQEVGHTKELGISFLASVLRAAGGNDKSRAAVPAEGAWLGDLTTHDIRPESRATPAPDGKARLNSWLPDEAAARAWQAFVKGER